MADLVQAQPDVCHVFFEFACPARHGQIKPERRDHESEFIRNTKPGELTAGLLGPIPRVTTRKLFPPAAAQPSHDGRAQMDVFFPFGTVHIAGSDVAQIVN